MKFGFVPGQENAQRGSNSFAFDRLVSRFEGNRGEGVRGNRRERFQQSSERSGGTSVSRNETLDAGAGATAPGVAVPLSGEGTNPDASLLNRGTIVGRGEAPPADEAAGDGVRFEGPRTEEGFEPATLSADVVNTGTITSESTVGPTAGVRFVDGVGVQGDVVNTSTGEISGANNGVYFGEGDHTGGSLLNAGTISSDSRAVNIDGDGLTVVNSGTIEGTGDQRNGTVYGDGTAENFTVVNTRSGVIDAGEGNDGSGLAHEIGDETDDVVDGTILNGGTIQGRGTGDTATTIGHGLRLNGGAGTDGTAVFAGDVVNAGTIAGSADSEAAAGISIEEVGLSGRIVNVGSISGSVNAIDASTATGGVNIVNAGEIDGNVVLSMGDDVFTVIEGASLSGEINAGGGFDTLNLIFDDREAAVQFADSASASSFERINIGGVQYRGVV